MKADTLELNGKWCGLEFFSDTCGISHAVFMTGTIEQIEGEKFYRVNRGATHDWVI